MLKAWAQRSEPLGLLVAPPMGAVHEALGDRMHRIVVRDVEEPLVVVGRHIVPLRSAIALLLIGRRVAYCLEDEDDIRGTVVRLCARGPHICSVDTAVWDGVAWRSGALASFL